MTDAPAIETLAGEAAATAIPDLARLRVAVFREWPYLYDGDLAYERRYLRKYADLPEATLVVARHGGRIVGAATALPLARTEEVLQAPFRAAGLDPRDWYYFGESVLEREFRGRGVGVAFFAAREARARALGYRHAAFCGVVRPDDHPARPAGYVPLDSFWRKRGYARRPELAASFSWKDLGDAGATAKPMAFWTRELG